ncbi:MAG: purine phosphorylase [Syntrophales bacterium]
MHPGIVAAMTREARILAGGPVRAGEVIRLRNGALFLLSGIGAGRARSAAQVLIEKGATVLISWGFASGLAPDLPPGSLILPERIASLDQSIYCVDPAWHAKMCDLLKTHVASCGGTIAEVDLIMPSEREKAALYKLTGAIAADMESASIALAAAREKIPFAVVRAITDPANVFIPGCVLHSIDEYGQLCLAAFFLHLIRNPLELPALARLGRSYLAARDTLTRAARAADCGFKPS